MDIELIKTYMPHRYPFLMLDRVIDQQPGKELTAIKNVTYNEPIFQGHFPDMAVFPGVMIVEAMAQASGILASISAARMFTEKNEMYYFAGLDKVRFKKTVVPGDQIKIRVEFIQQKNDFKIFKSRGTATVDGEVVCTAEILCAQKTAAQNEEGSEA